MLKGLNTPGQYITISGQTSGMYINLNSSSLGVGNMRFNPSTQNIEVFDGLNWQQINGSYATISLTPDAISVLDWAKRKQQEEFELETLARDNPAVKNAYNNLKKAEEQLKTTIILSKDEEQTTS